MPTDSNNSFMNRNGPQDSRDYQIIMASILIICTLGSLSSIFPVLNLALSIFVIISIGLALAAVAHHFYIQYKLDQEAFYGPIIEEEKEETR